MVAAHLVANPPGPSSLKRDTLPWQYQYPSSEKTSADPGTPAHSDKTLFT
jgi:hypothetical protein